jgi:transposase
MTEQPKLVQHKKKNGTVYVYKVVDNYWDPKKQQSRNKQICIGKLDPETGELIPSKRLSESQVVPLDPTVTARTTVSGPAMVLNSTAEQTGLTKTLAKAFPDSWRQILSLAWYVASSGDALSHAQTWCENHEVPFEGSLSSQRISELLERMSEDGQQTFFKLWGKQVCENDFLCYDITSVSSYSEQNEFVRWGYNRDKEKLPQVNLAMVYGQKSHLPVMYRILPGSITDVKTLSALLETFKKLGFPNLHLVMDRGFYSQDNINRLTEMRQNFTIAVPSRLKWVREEIDRFRNDMYGPEGYRKIGDETLYVHTRMLSWGEERRRCYAQLYFNALKAAEDYDEFTLELLKYREELEQEQLVPEHEEAYGRFFLCKRTPRRGLKVSYNNEAIEAYRNDYAGFFVILTTKFKDPIEALCVYRERDVVEKCFDDLKNGLDMKRLRVHLSGRMKSRMFIQFISLILTSRIRKTLCEKLPSAKHTPKSLLLELESLTTIRYTGKYKNRLVEATKSQREILAAFGLELEA